MLQILEKVVYNKDMKRFIFLLLFLAAVGGAGYVVLFVPEFFHVNPTGEPDGTVGLGVAVTGWDLMRSFWGDVFDFSHTFDFSPANVFTTYAIALFLVISAVLVVVVLLQWLFTGFKLRRISRFYTISLWFFVGTILLSGAYAWFAFDLMNTVDGSFTMRLFPWFAYIPIGIGLLISVLGGIFRQSEGSKVRRV